MSEGYDAAKETRDKIDEALKTEKAVEAVNEQKGVEISGKLAQMYNESANVGAENLEGARPYLKIHSAGRSTTNQLADGTEPKDGNFFYAPTQEEFAELTIRILTISRGFYTEQEDPNTHEKKRKWNQLMAGIILNDGEMKPFLMFITGSRLSPMWDFGKAIRKWTKRKPIPYPMFAMQVELKTHREKNSHNSWSHIIDFELLKDENDKPILISDEGEFQFVKDMTETMTEQINDMIAKKEIDEDGQIIQGQAVGHDNDPGPEQPY